MSSPGHSGAAILLVDDLPENLLALEAILSGLGHELVRAGSGPEALKELLRRDIALILLDVQMPGMDGFETAAQIKARERTQDVPIVFLTAIDGERHQAFRGYAAGAVDFLFKPFDPWVLRAKVEVFLELFRQRRELATRTDELAAARAALSRDDLPARAHAALQAARAACEAAEAGEDSKILAAALETLQEVEALTEALGVRRPG
ncbi:MAG TPA: response regulator [Sporichthyaceae bacterium]|nr:response regulator [Sporichthyaceae bacterium]